MADALRIPINRLRYKDPITAGMDPYTLLGMVPLLRKTAQDHPPIKVDWKTFCWACGTGTVNDGRHRWTSYVIAGRPDLPFEWD